jgi:hypothetical protein
MSAYGFPTMAMCFATIMPAHIFVLQFKQNQKQLRITHHWTLGLHIHSTDLVDFHAKCALIGHL